MKKIIFILLLLCACEPERSRDTTKLDAYYKRCIEGVTYIFFGHGFTVALGRDSKIIPCEVKR